MEPLSVLGAAAAVIQFIDFSTRLITASNDIFESTKGASARNRNLESITVILSEISDELGAPRSNGTERFSVSPEASKGLTAESLQKLAVQCQEDCGELLQVLNKLKLDRGSKSRRWKSIKAGVRTVWDSRKIEEFEKRLQAIQRTMILHITSFTSTEMSILGSRTLQIREENRQIRLDQSVQLEQINKTLRGMESQLRCIKLQHISSLERVDKLISKLAGVWAAHNDIKKQQAILSSLDFSSRTVRHADILESHARTFQWIFDSTLCHWLRHGQGIFWINGKAGSGKSTLMKFLADNTVTSSALGEWASPKSVAIVAHYFWGAGTPTQRSQQGLLQSLLYEIFRQYPDCISSTCHERWGKADLDLSDARSKPWSIAELQSTIQALCADSNFPLKCCFFIDGLDEFESDHEDLSSILVQLSHSSNFKFCVASRVLNVFEDAFKACGRLSIHEFTQNDIKAFAQDRLQTHPRWATCAVQEGERDQLIRTISDRADGVFLWVYLVTTSLRRGLTNDDDIGELQRRLDHLPNRLESLFQHMLDSVDPPYHRKMAGTFLIALRTRAPLNLDIYYHLDNVFRDKSYPVGCSIRNASRNELEDHQAVTQRRINARTCGLLEVRGECIEFLHQTVRDFLFTKQMDEYPFNKLPPQFDAALAISKAFVAKIKTTAFTPTADDGSPDTPSILAVTRTSPGDNKGHLMTLIRKCLCYAADVDLGNLEALSELLEDLECAVEALFDTKILHFNTEACHPRLLVRETLLQSRCHAYISHKIDTLGKEYFSIFQTSPLVVASIPPLNSSEIISLLLRHGYQANQGYKVKFLRIDGPRPLLPDDFPSEHPHFSIPGVATPWLSFCKLISPWSIARTSQRTFLFAINQKLFSTFLRNGADPNSRCPQSNLTPLAFYLLAVFELPSGYWNDTYVQTLDDFLRAGADPAANINIKILPKIFKHGMDFSYIEFCDRSDMTVLDTFCLRTRALYRYSPANIRYFCRVVMKKLMVHLLDDPKAREVLKEVALQVLLPDEMSATFGQTESTTETQPVPGNS